MEGRASDAVHQDVMCRVQAEALLDLSIRRKRDIAEAREKDEEVENGTHSSE